MLGQFGGDRVRHYLTPVNLSRLASVNCGMPTDLGIAVNGHLKVAGAYPLLHNLFEFGRCLLLLDQASPFLLQPDFDQAQGINNIAAAKPSK